MGNVRSLSNEMDKLSAATLANFKQYVSRQTSDNKTLDLLYANIKNAYTSTTMPPLPLGRSDRNLVRLQPVHHTLRCCSSSLCKRRLSRSGQMRHVNS